MIIYSIDLNTSGIMQTQSIYSKHHYAWFICLLAGTFYAYDFLLRVQPNILVHPLMTYYDTNAIGIGTLYAAYYWVYTPLQIPAGLLIDRYNTRTILVTSAILCACGGLLFGQVPSFTLGIVARILMGLGSAFAFVGALKLAALWLPHNQFSTFSGIATMMGTLGAWLTNTTLPPLSEHLGWKATIMASGYLGLFIAALLFIFLPKKRPEPLLADINRNTWKRILNQLKHISLKPAIWANGAIGCFMFLPITAFAGLWGTSFLQTAYHLTPQHAAMADANIFLGSVIGAPLGGYLSDYYQKEKPIIIISLLFSIGILLLIITKMLFTNTALGIALFILGFFSGPQVLCFSIAKQLSAPRTTGTCSAVTNCLISCGGLIFAPLIGHIMVSHWTGITTALGTPIYTLITYQKALCVLPIALFAALILALWGLPKTIRKTVPSK